MSANCVFVLLLDSGVFYSFVCTQPSDLQRSIWKIKKDQHLRRMFLEVIQILIIFCVVFLSTR